MIDFNIESLNSYLNHLTIEAWQLEIIEPPFEITPKQFLKIAENDCNSKEPNLINSLSNIKRAIHCQVDLLLYGLGWPEEKTKNWVFPKKIEVLNKIEIISPRILKKINTQRNLLEHKYKNPKKDEVEDALDIASLFILYTDKYLYNAINDLDLWMKEERDSFNVKLDYKNNKLIFSAGNVTKEITPNSEEYEDYIRWFVGTYKIKINTEQ